VVFTLVALARALTACLPFQAPHWQHPGTVPQALQLSKAAVMHTVSSSYSGNRQLAKLPRTCAVAYADMNLRLGKDCDNIFCPRDTSNHLGVTLSNAGGLQRPLFCCPACAEEGETVLAGRWWPSSSSV
jgi:hypothetical protein